MKCDILIFDKNKVYNIKFTIRKMREKWRKKRMRRLKRKRRQNRS
jgi:hypothetical protein